MPVASLPIHVVLPAFNEAEVLGEVVGEIRKWVDCPIIVIDDGSTDQTATVARAAGVSVVRHPINRGAGAACMTGITLARQQGWPCVAFMDSDGQHNPQDLIRLHETMVSHEADLVIGSRFLQKAPDIPVLRRFYNAIANLLTNAFSTNRYSDTQSGFRLLNRKAIEKIDLLQDEFSYCSEMIIQAEMEQLKVVECPINVRYTSYSMRKGQDFQVGVRTAFHFLWKLIFK